MFKLIMAIISIFVVVTGDMSLNDVLRGILVMLICIWAEMEEK